MRLLAALLVIGPAVAHPPTGLPPTKAWPEILEAASAFEAYKQSLFDAGRLACCMQPPKGSRIASCDRCVERNGSCACGINLSEGEGVCGECVGAWRFGRGGLVLEYTPYASPHDIPVLESAQQRLPDVEQDATDSLLVRYRELVARAKRTLVEEGRFECCIGDGGCLECVREGYCGCGEDLVADLRRAPDEPKEGVCAQCVDGLHGGLSRYEGVDPQHVHFKREEEHATGFFTSNRNQEGGGTAWLPAAAHHDHLALRAPEPWRAHAMGMATLQWTGTGGPRGERQVFSNSMLMLAASRDDGAIRWGGRLMLALDALTNGRTGYPNLLQTGESAFGRPLKDRQHPHDLFMEVAGIGSVPLGPEARVFGYAALAGEPALGTTAFQHRPSAWDNPEAPIGHHWNDGTHISFGVLTLGVALRDRVKLDASWFNGREPDEHRFDFDPIGLDSASMRATFNPTDAWSLSTSYAYLRAPERLEPGVDQRRVTAAAFYSRPPWHIGVVFGRNIKPGHTTDAWCFEAAWDRGSDVWFGRWERVAKDELVDVPPGTHAVSKLTAGYRRRIAASACVEWSLGAHAGVAFAPDSLRPAYGRAPATLGVFVMARLGPR